MELRMHLAPSLLFALTFGCGGPIDGGGVEPDDDASEDEVGDEEGGGPLLGTNLPQTCTAEVSTTGTPRAPVGAMHAVGDSILGWHKESSASIPDVTGRELGVEMTNQAVGGSTLHGEEGIPSQYVPGSYTHVLLNGGGNDFAADCSQAALDRMISADLSTGIMVTLVDRVTQAGAQAVIVGYYMPRDLEIGCEHFAELLKRYRRLGQEREDTMYVCTMDAIDPTKTDLYDGPDDHVHPSRAGSLAVGKAIAAALTP